MIAEAIVCLALNVYHEARGEPIKGQEAVALVTLNRAASHRYPDSVCDVVWQHKQFSWTHDGKDDYPHNGTAWATALQVADSVSKGEHAAHVAGATHYHADYVKPYWTKGHEPAAVYGKHIFYRGIK
jgi:spore germination cell wall hydrolase CwlJ-like protein